MRHIGMDLFRSFIGEDTEQVCRSDNDVLDYYENLMKKGEIIEKVAFSQSELEEGLFFYKNDVKVCLPLVELYRNVREKGSGFVNKKALERTYPCVVKAVDRKNKVVTLSMLDAQDKVRPMAIKKIDTALAKGETLIVPARVVYIPEGTAINVYLDLLGLGIKGRLSVGEWTDMYIPDLRLVCKAGDVINVAIIGKQTDYKPGENAYNCSRKATLPESAWDTIEEKAPVGSIVIIECLKREAKCFVGEVEGLNEVSAYCYYPDNSSGFVIKEGHKYRGYVSHCDASKRIFRCRVLQEVD